MTNKSGISITSMQIEFDFACHDKNILLSESTAVLLFHTRVFHALIIYQFCTINTVFSLSFSLSKILINES